MQILIKLSTCLSSFRAAFVLLSWLLWLGNAGERRGPNQVCFERSIIIIRMALLWNRRRDMFSRVIPVRYYVYSRMLPISLLFFFFRESSVRKFHDISNARRTLNLETWCTRYNDNDDDDDNTLAILRKAFVYTRAIARFLRVCVCVHVYECVCEFVRVCAVTAETLARSLVRERVRECGE